MKKKIHWVFWLIAVFGLLWNVGGIINYMMQMRPDFVASMPESHQIIINGRPTWATAGFAVGVFGGTIGCLFLLLKKPLAGFVLFISLMGILVTVIHTIGVLVTTGEAAFEVILQMVILPIIVANVLIFLTFYAIRKGCLSS